MSEVIREIVLDTETTGLEVSDGHRILNLACVEIIDRRETFGYFSTLINPERKSHPDSQKIHQISDDAVKDAPLFVNIADEFLTFLEKGNQSQNIPPVTRLIIHNAPFDMGFLNAEFARLKLPRDRHLVERWQQIISAPNMIFDTLTLARQLRPGRKNALAALREEYDMDETWMSQTIQNQYQGVTEYRAHSAIVDCIALAKIYLDLTRSQGGLDMSIDYARLAEEQHPDIIPGTLVQYATPTELEAHAAYYKQAGVDKPYKSPKDKPMKVRVKPPWWGVLSPASDNVNGDT